MTFLSKLIKEMNVCKHHEGGDWPILKDSADKIFRTIAEFPNAVDFSQSIKLYKIYKKKLKKFLQDRYSVRVATKMVALFDFSMPLDYRAFYKQLTE
jgi:hypothetical protein